MRVAAAALALALLTGCSVMQPHDFSALARSEAAAVVQVATLGRKVAADLPDKLAPRLASGFLVSEDGDIVTSSHVLEGGENVIVRLSDRRTFTATVVGADPLSDIALLKIDARGLPSVRVGRSSRLQPGQAVAAVGSPLGQGPAFTAGVVVAVDATLPGASHVPYIATDAAVPPGNSGGPLLNVRGEVVGVSSSIYRRSGGSGGVSFAVPIGVAMEAVAELRRHGKVTRGDIGLGVQELSIELARALRVAAGTGALIVDVLRDGPAASAGLRPADVVVTFGSAGVQSHVHLMRMIAEARPGDTVPLRYARDGRLAGTQLTVALAGGDAELMPQQASMPDDLGALLRAQLHAAYRPHGSADRGLLVRRVEGVGPRTRLRPGDIIFSINGRPVGSVSDFQEQLARAAGGPGLALLVQRDGTRRFMLLEAGE